MAHTLQNSASETLVNTQAAGNQTSVSVAALANGGFISVWTTADAAQDGSGSAIKGQLFNLDGSRAGAEFLVNTQKVASQFVPDVIALPSGGVLVSWSSGDAAQDGSEFAIKAQVFNANAAKVGNEFLVNTSAAGIQAYPEGTALANGGFVIGWRTIDSFQNVYGAFKAQVFGPDGQKSGSEFLVNQPTSAVGSYHFAPLNGGGFIATWGAADPAQNYSSLGIKAQRFDASGTRVGSELLVNTVTSSSLAEPAVTPLENGGFVVTWFTGLVAADGSISAIKGQVFDGNGVKVGSEFLVNTQAADWQSSPAITTLANGSFVVTWLTRDTVQDGSGWAIKAQMFSPDGAKLGSEFLVNTGAVGDQLEPDVTALANGQFVIAWRTNDAAQDGNGSAIKAKVFGFSNAVPVAADDTISTTGNTPVSVPFSALLGNDTDADSDALTIIGVSNPVNGTVAISGSSIVFTPNTAFLGSASFDYLVSDKFGGTDIGRVAVSVVATIRGTTDNDNIIDTGGSDIIDALAGVDTITITGGSDWIYGGDGDDTLILKGGTFVFLPGLGRDVLDLRQAPAGTAISASTVAGFPSAEVWLGSPFADVFTLTNAVFGDAMNGFDLRSGAGNDTVRGSPGFDLIEGGPGDDLLNGGAGKDVAVFAGRHDASGVVALAGGDLQVTTQVDGIDRLTEIEVLRFADGDYVWDDKSGTLVSATALTVPLSQIFSTSGFAGKVSGNAKVFGTRDFQDFSILAGKGSITLDGSFNQGGDVLRLPGAAQQYNIVLSGSSAVISDDITTAVIPIGTIGLSLVFSDGLRTLVYDSAANTARIGSQAFAESSVAIAAPAENKTPTALADPAATARVFMGKGSELVLDGDFRVFGTVNPETIDYRYGDLVLDASFNKGRDILRLPDSAQNYVANVSGSAIVLASSKGTIAIPVGEAGLLLDFPGADDRTLFYDAASTSVRIGSQAITQQATALMAFG